MRRYLILVGVLLLFIGTMAWGQWITQDISLEAALDLLLEQLQLDWMVRHEVLLISTPEELESLLVTKFYPVADLVVCRDEHDRLWDDYGSLIRLVQTVDPTCWNEAGGKCMDNALIFFPYDQSQQSGKGGAQMLENLLIKGVKLMCPVQCK